MKNIRGWATFAAIVILFIVIVLLMSGGTGADDIDYSNLQAEIKAGNIAAVYISDDFNILALKKDSEIELKNFPARADYQAKLPSRTSFATWCYTDADVGALIVNGELTIRYNDPSEGAWLTQMLPIIIAFGLAGVIIFIMFRMSQGGNNKAMNFGRTKARVVDNMKVRFNDVAGAEEEKEELREIVEFLKNPHKFTEVGARIPKGVLLVGSPGTGKTLFAKAVAGEAGVPFFSISGSDFVEMFVGVGASRVRDLFDQAKRNMPCIIFIDEIDAVGRQRGTGLGGGHDEREQTLNQLLVQMDGFATNEGIIVMAATNRADILDPALLRPGRFDRQIFVHMPDVRGREAIIKVHSRNKPLSGDINFKVLARMTSGFSGADIENLLNESAILAARDNRTRIIMKDILEGINKVIGGPRKTSRLVTETDKRVIAYHEAGHAIVAKSLPNCDNVQEVSIIPRGMAGGWTLSRPDNDDNLKTRGYFHDELAMIMGGRAAEEIVIQDITTGASSDIKQASGIARKMVTEWGMSEKIGMLYLGGSQEVFIGRDYQAQHTYSENIAAEIDEEIKKILDKSYTTALNILKSKRPVLDNMVKVLFEKETIYTDEVTALMEGASAEEVFILVDKRIAEEERANAHSALAAAPATANEPAAVKKPAAKRPAAKKPPADKK